MECEMCGRSIEEALTVRIEGSVMKVCGSCARFGERVEERKKIVRPSPWSLAVATASPTLGAEMELELLDDYPSIAKNARERKGLTQEQLGKIINERASVVNRIEVGKIKPDTKLVHKLENALGVKITGRLAGEKVSAPKPVKKELTLGDVVELKKKQA